MGSFREKSLEFLNNLKITVEPLMFILAACNTAVGIVTPSLSEAKMKRVYNVTGDVTDKFINKKMVEWDNNYSYVNLPIAMIVGVMYGGISDVHGRKIPLLIGIGSCVIENAMRMLIWSPQTDWPLELLFPTAAVVGLFGDFLLTMSCINAYVTDEFDDKRMLSIRMIIVSIIFSLGQYIASKLVKLMLDHQVELIVIMGIAEGLFILTILLGVLLLKSKKPKKAKLLVELPDQVHESQANLTAEEDSIPLTKIESFWQITKLSFISIYESAKIFLVPRDGHRRLFLYLCFLANFLDQFVFGEEKGLIGTYTKLAPFKWTAVQYASYKAWRPIAQILGMTFGLVVFKMLFKFRDTLIIVFAITSMGLCVLWIGLATASWMIYASLAPGSLHGLLNPLTYTFMSCIVEPDEIGKAFAISSIAQKLAGFAQTAVLQNIYIATVDWYQGFVWILMSVISLSAAVIYLLVHIVAKMERIGS